jgi:putative oxidoreductase
MSTSQTAAPKLMIPGLSALYQSLSPYSYALMRFCVGAILVPHGYQKLFQGGVNGLAAGPITALGLQPALAWAYWIGIVEFIGAIMLAIGLFTRPVALIILIEMVVIVFGINLSQGFFWTSRGFEYPLLLGLLCLAILFRGGDRLSVDRAIGKEL